MSKTDKPALLPPMPFGQSRAQVFCDLRAFTDTVSAVVDHPMYFDALGDARDFHHAAVSVNINGTHLVAITPATVKRTTTGSVAAPDKASMGCRRSIKSGRVNSVTTPFHYRVDDSEQLYLMIPFHGEATARVSGHAFPFEKVRDVFLSRRAQKPSATP